MTGLRLLDGVGLVGVALLLAGYALTVSGRVEATRPPALLLNLVGSLMILASLWGAFNLSSAAIEIAWAAIAGIGLARHARRR
ncbi:MAG: CBU_0592 family membrane protein [Janthinobacterium lividum]